jgi:hypothetical protein
VKVLADVVTDGARDAGVTELIGRWLSGGLDDIMINPVRRGGGAAPPLS